MSPLERLRRGLPPRGPHRGPPVRDRFRTTLDDQRSTAQSSDRKTVVVDHKKKEDKKLKVSDDQTLPRNPALHRMISPL